MLNGIGGKVIMLNRETFLNATHFELNIPDLEIISYEYSYPDGGGISLFPEESNRILIPLLNAVKRGAGRVYIGSVKCRDKKGNIISTEVESIIFFYN